MTNKKQKDFYTLNELASSGVLPWTSRVTVRKYVNAYPDIFLPKLRGGKQDKRYVISKKNVAVFLDKFHKGELRDFKKIRAGESRLIQRHISIVSIDNLKRARELREILENKKLRIDLVQTDSKREFMEVLGKTTKTYRSVIIVADINDGNISVGNEKIKSIDIRRIPDAVGISNKKILWWVNSTLSKKMIDAFEKQRAITFLMLDRDSKKALPQIQEWANKSSILEKISDLDKLQSYKLGRKI